MVDQPPVTDEERKEFIIAGALTSMIDITKAKPFLETHSEVQLSRDGSYLPYKNLKQFLGKKGAHGESLSFLNPKDIEQISITLPTQEIDKDGNPKSETQYFSKIMQHGGIAAKEGDPGFSTGFRAIAWVETGEAKPGQEPVPKLDTNGKANVVISFPGWKGGTSKELDNDTLSMHKIGRGELYPPTTDVKQFVDNVVAKLDAEKADGGMDLKGKYEVTLDSHSAGQANTIAAALLLEQKGITVKNIVNLDPLGKSLAERRIKAALEAKRDGKENALPENDRKLVDQLVPGNDPAEIKAEATKMLERLDKLKEKTDTLVPFRKEKQNGKEVKVYSRTALLESYSPKFDQYWEAKVALDEKMKPIKEQMEPILKDIEENKGNPTKLAELNAKLAPLKEQLALLDKEQKALTAQMEKEQAALQAKNLWDTVIGGKRDGKPRDADNDVGAGRVVEVDVTNIKPVIGKTFTNPDFMHLTPNITDAVEQGAKIEPVQQQVQGNQAAASATRKMEPSTQASVAQAVVYSTTAAVNVVSHVAHQVAGVVEHTAQDVGHIASNIIHSDQVKSALVAFRNAVIGGAHHNPTVKPQTIVANAKPKSDVPHV